MEQFLASQRHGEHGFAVESIYQPGKELPAEYAVRHGCMMPSGCNGGCKECPDHHPGTDLPEPKISAPAPVAAAKWLADRLRVLDPEA